MRPDLLETLSRLVGRLLKKDPEKRYPSAGELSRDLETCLDKLTGMTHPSPKTAHLTETASTKRTEIDGQSDSRSTLRSKAGFASLSVGLLLVLLAGYWLFPSSGSQASSAGRTIAVLPLESISREPNDLQFTDGVHEELINRLAGIGELTVMDIFKEFQDRKKTIADPEQIQVA